MANRNSGRNATAWYRRKSCRLYSELPIYQTVQSKNWKCLLRYEGAGRGTSPGECSELQSLPTCYERYTFIHPRKHLQLSLCRRSDDMRLIILLTRPHMKTTESNQPTSNLVLKPQFFFFTRENRRSAHSTRANKTGRPKPDITGRANFLFADGHVPGPDCGQQNLVEATHSSTESQVY